MAQLPRGSVSAAVLQQIEEAIGSMRYGTVQLTIHDARVVQIEKLEKVRITPLADLPGPPPRGEGTTGSDDEDL